MDPAQRSTEGLHGQADFEVDYAGCTIARSFLNVDLENPVHPRERNHDAAGAGDGSAAQSCSRARGPPSRRRVPSRSLTTKTHPGLCEGIQPCRMYADLRCRRTRTA